MVQGSKSSASTDTHTTQRRNIKKTSFRHKRRVSVGGACRCRCQARERERDYSNSTASAYLQPPRMSQKRAREDDKQYLERLKSLLQDDQQRTKEQMDGMLQKYRLVPLLNRSTQFISNQNVWDRYYQYIRETKTTLFNTSKDDLILRVLVVYCILETVLPQREQLYVIVSAGELFRDYNKGNIGNVVREIWEVALASNRRTGSYNYYMDPLRDWGISYDDYSLSLRCRQAQCLMTRVAKYPKEYIYQDGITHKTLEMLIGYISEANTDDVDVGMASRQKLWTTTPPDSHDPWEVHHDVLVNVMASSHDALDDRFLDDQTFGRIERNAGRPNEDPNAKDLMKQIKNIERMSIIPKLTEVLRRQPVSNPGIMGEKNWILFTTQVLELFHDPDRGHDVLVIYAIYCLYRMVYTRTQWRFQQDGFASTVKNLSHKLGTEDWGKKVILKCQLLDIIMAKELAGVHPILSKSRLIRPPPPSNEESPPHN